MQISIGISVKGAGVSGPPPVPFTTEWTTTAPSESIALPYTVGTGTYSGTIDWGDGNTDVNDGTTTFHTYATAGTYTVIITGDCIGWDFGQAFSGGNITSVVNWGQLQLGPDNFGYNFAYCPNLDLSSVQGTLDLTGVTVLDGLFFECFALTTINNINSWDTSAITSMNSMFGNCTAFNQALSFDTSAVLDMSYMFKGCTSFNQPLTFYSAAVTNISNMFSGCSAFNSVLLLDTSLVTNMSSMFLGCSVFNEVFYGFAVGLVVDMSSMFSGCTAFNQPIGDWNTSTVEDMSGMFKDATAFNQSISSWNTVAVTDMGRMFENAPAFDHDLGSWNVANVANFNFFMQGKTPATFSTNNLNAIYNGWSAQAVQPSLNISFGTAKYTVDATLGRLILTGTALWTITDGGL